MLSDKIFTKIENNYFFGDISSEKIRRLDDKYFDLVTFNTDDIIIKEDTKAEKMYLITSGNVRITKKSPDGKEIEIAKVGENEFVGDLSLIEEKKRSANVIAITPVETIAINKENFHSIFNNFPQIKNTIARNIADKLRDLNRKTSSEIEKSMNLVELNERIIAQKQELEELNAMKDKFFMIIAHDLKNPLTTLVGSTDILNRLYDRLSEKDIRESIARVDKSAKSLKMLLDNLLEWAKTQTGKLDFNPQKIDLSLLVEKNISILLPLADAKDINLTNQIETGTMVFADKHMITTVIRNLVSNAIKFTSAGGEVTISATDNDDEIEISVSDTGIGIKQEDISKLFRIGVHHTTEGTCRETGTGLGLIICKDFIEKHGGNIWLDSNPGEGSTFHFTLPNH